MQIWREVGTISISLGDQDKIASFQGYFISVLTHEVEADSVCFSSRGSSWRSRR